MLKRLLTASAMIAIAGAACASVPETHAQTGLPLNELYKHLYSPFFAPVYDPTIKTGTAAMTAAAMDVLGK